MKVKDVREFTDAELTARIAEDKALLQKLYFNHAVSAIENPAKIRNLKRDIARMKTVITERKNSNANKA
jgi:large subunit ribosomal protein L29